MSMAETAVAVFAFCNSVRIFAYLPQIIAVARDQNGATAISYTTWALFAASHVSTMAYAFVVLDDWRMAAVFGANTACCTAILAVTAFKRAARRLAPHEAEADVVAACAIDTVREAAMNTRLATTLAVPRAKLDRVMDAARDERARYLREWASRLLARSSGRCSRVPA